MSGRGSEGQIARVGESEEKIQTDKAIKQIKIQTCKQMQTNKQTAGRDNGASWGRGHATRNDTC